MEARDASTSLNMSILSENNLLMFVINAELSNTAAVVLGVKLQVLELFIRPEAERFVESLPLSFFCSSKSSYN